MTISQTALEQTALEQSALDRLRLVAISHFFLGGLTVCVMACAAAGLFGSSFRVAGSEQFTSFSAVVPFGVMVVLGLVLAALSITPILSAVCILGRKFRWLSILVSILFLPFFPIGTIISIYSLMALTSPAAHMAYRA